MDDLPKAGPTPRFQILALDGGGIKGLFAAATLAAIEEDCGTAVADHFDLIAGTSTGGIIALALGMGKRPREIVDFYLSNGRRIFPQTFGLTWLRHWFRAKFSPDSLEAVLQECLGDRLFGQSQKRLVIPAYSLGEDDVYVFRTPHVEHLSRDYRVPAWKVAVATSSAPTYFPSCRHVDRLRLIDGGVWANNPTMVGIVEAAAENSLGRDSGLEHWHLRCRCRSQQTVEQRRKVGLGAGERCHRRDSQGAEYHGVQPGDVSPWKEQRLPAQSARSRGPVLARRHSQR
jgi:patatin-like phospholipase/acyl hydrolase